MSRTDPPAGSRSDPAGPQGRVSGGAAADGETLRGRLLSLLQAGAAASDPAGVRPLIEALEQLQPADLNRDRPLLAGVWQLRWSSSALPYLAVAPWLENLQLLDPERGRAMNLLRLAGPLGPVAGIAVQAELSIEPAAQAERSQRVNVRFRRGGWLGPRLAGHRLALLRQVNQDFPAWLDITVLDRELRICRGSGGTLFALLRRRDLRLQDLLPQDD